VIQFQYVSLLRYATQMHVEYKRTKFELDEKCGQLHKLYQAGVVEHNRLEEMASRMGPLQDELEKHRQRVPAIREYLELVPVLVEYVQRAPLQAPTLLTSQSKREDEGAPRKSWFCDAVETSTESQRAVSFR
jgi:hypothetical protein